MQSKNQTIFLDGTHLMLDCFGCDKKLLADTLNITQFLDRLPGELGMKKLMKKPYLSTYEGGNTWDKGGVSAFMMIAESHISIHTFPHDGFFTADVYSCKPFDVEKAISEFRMAFRFKTHKINVVKRDIEVVREKNLAKITRAVVPE